MRSLSLFFLFSMAMASCQKDDDVSGAGGSGGNNNNTGGATGCPTTANCGCSNKLKADCNTSCCAWVVGQGCKCR